MRLPACLPRATLAGSLQCLVARDSTVAGVSSNRLWLLAALGGARLDLAAAQVEAPESVITAVVVLGGAALLVPQGVPVQLSGFSLFGGKADRRAAGPSLQGSPLVRVRAFTFFGGVAVKESPGRRSLLEIIKSPRKQPTST